MTIKHENLFISKFTLTTFVVIYIIQLLLFGVNSFFKYFFVFLKKEKFMFKERLKQLRTEQNLTQKELAKNINTSQQNIGFWETGKRNPKYDMIEKLANFFNVSTDYLTGKSNIKHPESDIDKAIDKSVAYNGKPITNNDREAIKAFLSTYFSNKD